MIDFLYVLMSGVSIGVLGSFHCIGMCGPLAMSLPVHQLTSFRKSIAITLYNLGRATTYALLGVLFGIIGLTFSLFKVQQWLSIVAGVAILLVLLFQQFGNPNSNKITYFTNQVKTKLAKYLTSDKSTLSYLNIGILNGLLPCGLVYVALAASFAAGSVVNGALLMFGFGLGTFPAMAATMFFGKFISLNVRKKINQATPYLIMGVAVLLILRGLNLGIPYISPTMANGHMNCCHK